MLPLEYLSFYWKSRGERKRKERKRKNGKEQG
jgi:hypothetical protein